MKLPREIPLAFALLIGRLFASNDDASSGALVHDRLLRVSGVGERAAEGDFESPYSIACRIGKGKVWVREVSPQAADGAHLVLVFTERARLLSVSPSRIFEYDREGEVRELRSAGEALERVLRQKAACDSDAEIATWLQAAILRSVYGGLAEFDEVHFSNNGRAFEFRAKARLFSGIIETVNVEFQSEPARLLKLEREVSVGAVDSPGKDLSGLAENWEIKEESGWRPPRRYSTLYRFALMGSTKMKYELGRRLVSEPDEATRLEGIRWLEEAANEGMQAAVDELVATQDYQGRSERDREGVRKHRCGAPSRLLDNR